MILFSSKNKTLLLFLVIFCCSALSYQGLAQNGKNPKRDLENKSKKLKDEIKQINAMLEVTKANKKSSIGVLVNINLKLEKRQELINTINAQIRSIDRDIKKNEVQAEQLKSSLDKLKREYARMIVFAQRNQDAYSMLMFIFAAENFTQAYSRLKYMQQYSEFRKKQALEIINTQTQLIAHLKALKDQRQEKNALLGLEQDEKKNLSTEKVEQEQVLTVLQTKEKELKAELEKKKSDAIKLQAEIRRLIEAEIKRKAEEARREAAAKLAAERKAREEREKEAAKNKVAVKAPPVKEVKIKTGKPADAFVPELSDEAVALSEDFSNNRGKLPFPVAKGVICETYGEHEHPAIKGFMMFNNGLEICANKGTQVRAVFAGEVTSIAISPTGGKLVIIRHGEYLSVYCNLEDILVKTGDRVNVKQVIATVMYNEDDDKTSMNFQIWKGQKAMDPGGWLYGGR